MSPEAQRIAIAEACGGVWVQLEGEIGRPLRMLTLAFNDAYQVKARGAEQICNPTFMWKHGVIPDYVNDLNAMAEAEKVLGDAEEAGYFLELQKLCVPPYLKHFAPCIRATAAQKAEALLKALGKWTP